MKTSVHPARSPEFLSRLHDGELDAGERAQFETHRAHCAECRAAASEFESALAFFRASRPSPPPPDLAARILRKLQASSPRRAPLGRTFGIDLKWAGAFAAALVAVIVGSAVVVEKEARRRAAAPDAAPIRVVVDQPRDRGGSPPESSAAPSVPPAPPAEVAESARRSAPAAKPNASSSRVFAAPRARPERDERANAREEAADSLAAGRNTERAGAASAREPAPARELKKDAQTAASARMQQEPAAPPAAAPESIGGEGASAQSLAAEAPSGTIRVRIVGAPDGNGTAPALLNAASVLLTDADRGDYRLLVRGDGSVASVEPLSAREKTRRAEAPLKEDANKRPAAAAEELKKLRFAVSDRPRQLLIRIE